MNKNIIRITVGTALGIVLVFLLVFLLRSTLLIWVAFAWSIWALVVFALAMSFWARGTKTGYVLNAAYPAVVISYLSTILIVSAVFVILEQLYIFAISYGWFCLIQLIITAVFAWRLQAMDAARQKILEVEKMAKCKSVNWKMITVEISAVEERSPIADRDRISRTVDAVRFADPMEHESVASLAEEIQSCITELGNAVDAGESDKIAALCTRIENKVKERKNKLMIFK